MVWFILVPCFLNKVYWSYLPWLLSCCKPFFFFSLSFSNSYSKIEPIPSWGVKGSYGKTDSFLSEISAFDLELLRCMILDIMEEIRGICKVRQRQGMGSFLDGTCVINRKKNKWKVFEFLLVNGLWKKHGSTNCWHEGPWEKYYLCWHQE